MTLTTTDLKEYRSIPQQLRRLQDSQKFYKFINDVLSRERVEDEMATLRRRRIQLRRQGAY